jgi:hypothetical protein
MPAHSNDAAWELDVDLSEPAIDLRQQMAFQLSQVILRTKAIRLDPEVLIGAILEAVEDADPATTARRKRRGDAWLTGLSHSRVSDLQATGGDEA